MDPALIGTARVDYSRVGVYNTLWDDVLAKLENTSANVKVVADSGTVKADEGTVRADVFNSFFDDILTKVEQVT